MIRKITVGKNKTWTEEDGAILSVIIPQYKEDENVIKDLLSSINTQQGINFRALEVAIVNDGSKVILSDEFLKSFTNLDIKYVRLEENKGPGIARQTGIDNATGQWIIFADADDVFYGTNTFKRFLEDIDDCNSPRSGYFGSNLVIADFLEVRKDGRLKRVNKDGNWLFAKLIRKSYLDGYNVRFSTELRLYEDTYFIRLMTAPLLGEDTLEPILYDRTIVYMWRFNRGSLTREGGSSAEYTMNTVDEYVKSCKLVLDRIKGFKEALLTNISIYLICSISESKVIESYCANECKDRPFTRMKEYKTKQLELSKYICNTYPKEVEELINNRTDIIENHVDEVNSAHIFPIVDSVDCIRHVRSILNGNIR